MLGQQEKMSPVRTIRCALKTASAARIWRYAMLSACAFLCARSALFGVQVSGTALFAAGLCSGGNTWLMLLCCIAGCLSVGSAACIWPAFACLGVWLIMCVLKSMEHIQIKSDKLKNISGRISSLVNCDTDSPEFITASACAAGAANLIMTAALMASSRSGIIYCAISALMGFGLTPVFASGLIEPEHDGLRVLSARMLICAACASGMRGMTLGIIDIQSAFCAAALGILACRINGRALKRALLGLMLGALLSAWLWAADVWTWRLAAYPLAGMLAGVICGVPGAAICALCGITDGTGGMISGAIGACCAAIVQAVTCAYGNKSQLDKAERAFRNCIEQECAFIRQKLARLEADIDDMISSEPPMSRIRELNMLRSAMCADCPQEGRCWRHADSAGYSAFIRLREAMIKGEHVRADMLPDGCIRGNEAPNRMSIAAHKINMSKHRHMLIDKRRDLLAEERRRIGAQAHADMRGLERMTLDFNASLSAQGTLRAAGLSDVCVCISSGEDRLAFISDGAKLTNSDIELVQRELMRATGLDFEVASNNGSALKLRQRSRLSVHGAVRRYAQSAGNCGDSALITRLSDGRWLAALSDGKGRGDAAARESCAALAIVNRLLDDGVRPESALEIANAILQLRGEDDEMYATLDMLLIDPESGRADAYKLGATPSVLISGGRARVIGGSALPCGILPDAAAAHRLARLKGGDRLIMLSDGVCDFSDGAQKAALMNLSCALLADAPDSAAERLIARMRTSFDLDDDAAVIVLDISARKPANRHHFFIRSV